MLLVYSFILHYYFQFKDVIRIYLTCTAIVLSYDTYIEIDIFQILESSQALLGILKRDTYKLKDGPKSTSEGQTRA